MSQKRQAPTTDLAEANYAKHYNSRAKDKHFEIGDQVVVLTADSTNKLYARWRGPRNIVEVRALYSYLIELPDSSVRHVHANSIRPWVTRVNLVGIIEEDDDDFGDVRYAPTDPVVDDLPSAKIDPDRLGNYQRPSGQIYHNCLIGTYLALVDDQVFVILWSTRLM